MKKIGLALAILANTFLASSGFANEYWTHAISEESPRNEVHCRAGYAIAGVACQGSYCDNVSFLCRSVGNLAPWGWSNWFSEESHGVVNSGMYTTGMSCRGSYCDDMSLYYSRGPWKNGQCYTSGWTSEENPPVQCQYGYTVSGMSCSGRYCDNVQLTCCN